jgi:peptidyl-prolyl cis-trans isomerase D
MDSSLQKKTSSIIVTILIGLIIISFMFTGYESISGSPDSVGKVGPYKIKIEEYQRAFNQQMQFYQQVFKDQKMSTQQMDNIKQTTYSSLVNSKLSLILADKIGLIPGTIEIKDFIREQEYFKTEGQFDKSKYFAILANVGITPKQYEEDMAQAIKQQSLQTIFSNYPLSKKYLEDLKALQTQSKTVNILNLDPSQLEKYIEVNDEEIKTYLADVNNVKKVESVFESKKNILNMPEQVRANHILLKADETNEAEVKAKAEALMKQLNTNNFKELADKNTEDPSGKGQGGSLGWFGRGRMVPEFENAAFAAKVGSIVGPVKTEFGFHLIQVLEKKEAKEAQFDGYKLSLAKELIQKSKRTEITALETKIMTEAKDYLQNGNSKSLGTLAARYNLKFDQDQTINPIDNFTHLGLNAEQVSQVFFTESKPVYEYKDGAKTILVGLSLQAVKAPAPIADADFEKEQSSTFARELNQKVLEHLKEETSIKQNKNLVL